ncbi:MAG: SH3 domain-containing protein [Erythrobacter sp.]
MAALRLIAVLVLTVVLIVTVATGEARAQDREVPYWATLRYNEVNMRVGPSMEYKIDWVYKREGLPVKVVRVREGWRLIQDHEGTQGWVASRQLSPKLGVLIIGDGLAEIRADASPQSALRWRAEPGVVGDLLRCRAAWCEIDIAGRTGWVAEERIWGVGDVGAGD